MGDRDIVYISPNFKAREVVAKYAGHYHDDYVEHLVNSQNQTLKTTIINEHDLPGDVVTELVRTRDRCFNQVKLPFNWDDALNPTSEA